MALVTGASGRIGSAIAGALGESGAVVALGYGSRPGPAEELAGTITASGGRAEPFQVDLQDPGGPSDLVAQVEAKLGPVDVLVANAGVDQLRDWREVTAEDFDETLAVNLRAPFLLAQSALPGMQERGFGRVLFMSAVVAFSGGVLGPHYSASKAGLHGVLHFLARRVAADHVTVNALAPGVVENDELDPDDREQAKEEIPLHRLAQPEEIADLAVAVLSNPHITDQVVSIDGGSYPLRGTSGR